MAKLEEEIKKLGYPYEKKKDGFEVEVSIPKWDIDDVVLIYEDEEKYYIDDYSGWEVEFFYKDDFPTLEKAIENRFHPIEETMKVFVLTAQGKSGANEEVYLEVSDVFTTKTAAKDALRMKRKELLDIYEENYSGDYEISSDDPVLFSIACCSSSVWDELLITEKEIKV